MSILTQVISLLAMGFSVMSFQMNKRRQIVIMQIITAVLFCVQYFLLGALTGAMLNAVAIVRNIMFYHQDKKWMNGTFWTAFFAIAMTVVGALSWQGPMSLLMMVSMVFNTISLSCAQPKMVRRFILVSSPFALIYNIWSGSIGGILNEVFVEISTISAIFRLDRKKP